MLNLKAEIVQCDASSIITELVVMLEIGRYCDGVCGLSEKVGRLHLHQHAGAGCYVKRAEPSPEV